VSVFPHGPCLAKATTLLLLEKKREKLMMGEGGKVKGVANTFLVPSLPFGKEKKGSPERKRRKAHQSSFEP